ncbi:hypothetical protein LLEC1_03681 [Akanthomyces lecanii]|uniref:Uncharacterized protein n=1 Tax=Cordyceps confragosa TaxID=2714763 RepID=A0A179I422_CORDF|nr:hypothetical protein LLEC1_03681 [Akanthomyces lecanii]
MFYDTSHNSHATVLKTLRAAFRQTALKMWAYMRALGRISRPRPDVVKRTFLFLCHSPSSPSCVFHPVSSLYFFHFSYFITAFEMILPFTIIRTVEASYLILTSRFRKLKNNGYECDIRKSQVAQLAYEAFEEILSAKQTQHTEVVAWLRGQIAKRNNTSS